MDAGILSGIVTGYLYVAAAVAGVDAPSTELGGLDAFALLLNAWTPILVPGLILALVLGAVYAAVFALLFGGRTPGRLLTGIRLVDGTGLAPGPVRAVIRAVLSVFSFVLLLGGFWLALFDRRGQTLHDKLAGTFVVQPADATS